MAIDLINIKPGLGLGVIKFGMIRQQLRMLLGEPDEKEQYEQGHFRKVKTEAWHYDATELSLGFDEAEDWRLVELSVTSEKYQLNGKSLIGLNRLETIRSLNNMDITDLVFESSDPDQDMIASESTGIILWLDKGIVSEIQWGALLIDPYTVSWPE